MLRRISDRNIWLVFSTIFVLGLAYGIALSLLAVFLDGRGFTKSDIGSLAVWFALGIVALSLPMGTLIRRFSARATLIASLAGYGIAVAVFPFLPGFASMAVVRFFDGACSVGVWISCETILLLRADEGNKAFVTSLYAISMALGYVIGPLVAKLVVALGPMSAAFLVSGVLAGLAALMVLWWLAPDHSGSGHETRAAPGEAPRAERLTSSGALLWRIKTSCLATFTYGYFQSSVVLFLPLYLIELKGITKDQTILVPAFFASGMLIFSNIAGRLGDRRGHLAVMRTLAVIGTSMILAFVFLDRYAAMGVAVFIAGATLAPVSPVSLALQGVIVAPRDYSRSNALYNAFYATGMLLGPPLSSRIYGSFGGATMLYHLAALWMVFVVFSIVFATDDPAARGGQSAPAEAAIELPPPRG